jgi:hypothetical protein
MRNVFPVKYYRDEGFIEHKLEIDDEDLQAIIAEYLHNHADFDFDEVEVMNNRPVNLWLYAKCRKYVDPPGTENPPVVSCLRFRAPRN